jgi:TIR domain
MAEQKFDVFLCHNSEDKPAVIEIAEQLQRRGLKPWLDVWELQPGAIWQYALEQQIESIGCCCCFRGAAGPWALAKRGDLCLFAGIYSPQMPGNSGAAV